LHEKSLTVEYQHEADKWTPCFTLGAIKLPAVAYLGFSAETGELADNHDIVAVETRNLYNSDGRNINMDSAKASKKKGRGKNSRQSGGSWFWTFLKFIFFGCLITGAYVGYTAYRTHKNRSRF
jgi:mannose-binding lectin 2